MFGLVVHGNSVRLMRIPEPADAWPYLAIMERPSGLAHLRIEDSAKDRDRQQTRPFLLLT